MPKKVFWPAAMFVMGSIFLAINIGMLSNQFANLWSIVLIVAGLGGLLVSDREEWLVDLPGASKKSAKVKKTAKPKTKTKKTATRKTKK